MTTIQISEYDPDGAHGGPRQLGHENAEAADQRRDDLGPDDGEEQRRARIGRHEDRVLRAHDEQQQMTADGQLQEHHRLQALAVKRNSRQPGGIADPFEADQQEAETLGERQQPHQAGEDEHTVHVPAFRLRRGRDVVIRDGHDRNVVEQRQHDDHRRRQRLKLEEHDRRHDQQHDVERHRDAVVDVALDALEDLPRADDGVDDGREAGRGQDQGGGAARGIGGAADGDAAIGLAQGRRIVDAVAGHRDDVAALLQRS